MATKNERLDRFIINYNGNKYREVKKILKEDDELRKKIFESKYIAEPFGGIFGFSRACYELGYKGKFLINDINKDLIDILKKLKGNPTKVIKEIDEEAKKINETGETRAKRNKLFLNSSRGCKLLYRGMCEQFFDYEKGQTKIKNYLEKKSVYNKFYKRVTFYNLDCIEFIEKVEAKKPIYFFDPPYFDSSNEGYFNINDSNRFDVYYDNTTFYIKILESFKKYKSLLIINKVDILNYMFKDYIYKEEIGTYGNTLYKRGMKGKNKKHHITYTNIINKKKVVL